MLDKLYGRLGWFFLFTPLGWLVALAIGIGAWVVATEVLAAVSLVVAIAAVEDHLRGAR